MSNTEKIFKILGIPLLILLFLAQRIFYYGINDYVIINDGILYVSFAEQIANGELKDMLNIIGFNFFPVIIVLVSKLVGIIHPISMETAALIFNNFCHVITVWIFYKLGKIYGNYNSAFAAGFFALLLPPLNDVFTNVLREPLAITAFVLALFFIIKAMKDKLPNDWHISKLFLAGMFFILAGFVRMEFFIGIVALGFVILFVNLEKNNLQIKRRLTLSVSMFSIFLIAYFAAIGFVKLKHDRWELPFVNKIFEPTALGKIELKDAGHIQKDSIIPTSYKVPTYNEKGQPKRTELYVGQFIAMADDHRRVLFAFEVAYKYWKALSVFGLFALLAGLFTLYKKRSIKFSDPYLIFNLAILIIATPIFYMYASNKFYLATRHTLLCISGLIPLMALPFSLDFSKISLDFETSRYLKYLVCIFWIITVSIVLRKDFRLENKSKVFQKQYGLELLKKLEPNSVISAAEPFKTVLYYAKATRFSYLNLSSDLQALITTNQVAPLLLLNTNDAWQNALLEPIRELVTPIDIELKSEKYGYILLAPQTNKNYEIIE